ncbi:MAG: family 43 glycosylhydrolase [Pyrinomonadaceae bacterium]|nr:family 43 glycosylhydrolase [Pyrinomonadaceae bacterium]
MNGAIYTNPALAGDYPDPSVIRVGRDYWATATTSEWGPEFPILHSRDLVNWRIVGAVFRQRPAWSVGNYWAPEISQDRGRYFVYYTARKKDGPLCVAVATAAKPSGPYTDHGPLTCQEAGSIDAFPIRDEKGKLYLVWKEDGNSRKLPTPIWAQPLSSDGTKLIGDKKELIRNDAPWEAQLVEGPFIMQRGGWFYMFYSGNACCGRECNYALGVARSRALLGPWEKNGADPILKGNDQWKCPGHGSIVSDVSGRDFLLYHAYHPEDSVYVGRQALLDEVEWGKDGWPTINEGRGPRGRAPAPLGIPERNAEYTFFDDFAGPRLSEGWQWPQANQPRARINRARGGRLILEPNLQSNARRDVLAAVVARSTTVGDYTATTRMPNEMSTEAFAGLAAYGDSENALGVGVNAGGEAVVWRREKNEHNEVAKIDKPRGSFTYLRMRATDGRRYRFAVSGDGRNWKEVGGDVNGEHLPPWDRGVRVALTRNGAEGAGAVFDWLRITPAR